jgi:hypothetical protein
MCEAVTKPVPSAKADSSYSTFDSRYCRTGLSHPATARLEHRFVPPPVLNVEFRNSLVCHLSTQIKKRLRRVASLQRNTSKTQLSAHFRV